MDRLLATSELAGIPVTARPPAERSQSSGVVQGVDGDFTDEALLAAITSEEPVIAATRQGTSLVLRPHSADSAECQLWQRERRLATIKASAPTYLPHREAQAALRSSPIRTGGPPLNQAKGKSYAAVVGAPSKVVAISTHPRQPGAEQRRPPSGPKKQGSVMPRPPTKATPESHLDQENTDLRLLLRAVADLLPPENQLRSICLQAGGVPPPNSHHG
ncbi:hypothetical protein MTO96_029226 [Rhipicephalus appendiculatus]